MLDSLELLKELVAIPGPPGQEEAVREAVNAHVQALGLASETDAKGNLRVTVGGDAGPRVVVTAHLDEIALMVSRIEPDGKLRVTTMGGVLPWKWGEQPVELLTRDGALPGVLSFGSVHTEARDSVIQQARSAPLEWRQAYIFTGLMAEELRASEVRPGTRVVIAPERRRVMEMGEFVACYFIDDRADLVAWLLALEALGAAKLSLQVVFAATTAEEVGGEGASYLLHQLQPEVCVALEIGPSVPESPFMPDEDPTIWVTDSYSSTSAADLEMLADACASLGQRPHWQALSRGGSDASCTAQRGLTARPITLGLPVENSHGLEIMHRDAPRELARLLVEVLKRIGT